MNNTVSYEPIIFREIMMQRQKEILEKEIEERMIAGLTTSMENRYVVFTGISNSFLGK